MNSEFNSGAFMTQTIRKAHKSPGLEDAWPIAIDIGYSSVKVISPNSITSFPSYAKSVPYGTGDSSVGEVDKNSIVYRDKENNEFMVGASALKMTSLGDADSSTAALYVRDRYFSKEFKVISETGIAFALMPNEFGGPQGKKISVMTGLPPSYLKGEDSEILIEVLSGHHDFYLKVGNEKEWRHISYDIPTWDINIMPQPMGTLISISLDENGRSLEASRDYYSSNILIMDTGFGTLDTFDIQGGYIRENVTWDDLGMKRVLEETSAKIREKYGEFIPVSAMQEILGQGYFSKIDKRARTSKKCDISPLLEEASTEVCRLALNAINGKYQFLQSHKYLVVTGGTGAAWLKLIRNHYAGMETLHVINGKAPKTEAIFSNVRGYYFQLLNTKKKR